MKDYFFPKAYMNGFFSDSDSLFTPRKLVTKSFKKLPAPASTPNGFLGDTFFKCSS